MSSKLDRLEAWFDYQNALDDSQSRRHPSWWHAAKIVLGLAGVGKSVALTIAASSFGGYALALLFLVMGAALAHDGANSLLDKWLFGRA